jgi:hypothetical protein
MNPKDKMEQETAEKVLTAVLQATAVLNESVFRVQEEANDEDFRSCRLAVGQVLATMHHEILVRRSANFLA